jgi:hypothetical protein
MNQYLVDKQNNLVIEKISFKSPSQEMWDYLARHKPWGIIIVTQYEFDLGDEVDIDQAPITFDSGSLEE